MEDEIGKGESSDHTGVNGVSSRGIVEFEEPETCED